LSDFRAYWVCSRLLEMAVFRVPPACRGNLKEGVRSLPPLREGNRAGIRVGVRAKRKMRPEESRRTPLDFTEVGGVELHTPATDCRA
jgi:hypothetical protein